MEQINSTFDQQPFTVSKILAKVPDIEKIISKPKQQPINQESESWISGINELAKFLKVLMPIAQREKSDKAPYSQVERTIINDKAKTLILKYK